MATAPSSYELVNGPTGSASYPALVYKDANGSLATVTTPWYLNASGVYIPAPVDANGNPQMSITGSSTTLPVSSQGGYSSSPILLATIPYSSFAASTAVLAKFLGSMSRNASKRGIYMYSSLNEAFSSNPYITVWDSSITQISNSYWGEPTLETANIPFTFTANSNEVSYGTFSISSGDAVSPNILSLPVDSVGFQIPMGTTAPTSGNVYIFYGEVK